MDESRRVIFRLESGWGMGKDILHKGACILCDQMTIFVCHGSFV